MSVDQEHFKRLIDQAKQYKIEIDAATEQGNRLMAELEETLQKLDFGIKVSVVMSTNLDSNEADQDITKQTLLGYNAGRGFWVDRGAGPEPLAKMSRDLRWQALGIVPHLIEAICETVIELREKINPKTFERAEKVSVFLKALLLEGS